jgi:predicted Zn-dependent protease
MIEGGMITQSHALELLGNVLSYGVSQRVDQLEAVLVTHDRALTRFARSRIHQHMAERNIDVGIRVIAGKKQGCVHINSLELSELEDGVERALKIAKVQKEHPDFVSLPGPDADRVKMLAGMDEHTYQNTTAVHPPEAKANEVRDIIDNSTKKDDEHLAGAYMTEVSEVAVVNSLGIEAYIPYTLATMNVNINGPKGATGYSEFISRDVSDLNVDAMAKELKSRLRKSKNPEKIDAKSYPVIFEHYAVGELMVFLSYMGFSAKAVSEGWSFMCDQLGNKIVSPMISIWDDGLDPKGLPIPFDYEGVPKQKVELITEGVARDVVHDSFTAAREERPSTGHALPAPNPHGPQPMNMFMGEGDSTLKEMIEDTKKGMLVTRIHYANPLDPKKTLLTGMTRDGTFLIEKGEVKTAVKNLRFTQSLLESFSTTRMVGKDSQPTRSWYGGSTVPCLKVDAFNFTGTTEH